MQLGGVNVKNVYIMFSFTGTYFSRSLCMMSGEKYIHVSIAFDENLKEVYSFGRKNPRWMFPCGFVMEDMNLISSFFKNAVFKMYELPLTKKEYKNLRKELKKYQDRQNEYHYNVKGLIHIQFHKVYHRNHHFVCSQFIAKLLSDSNIHTFDKDYSVVRPKDIAKIPRLKLVHEGKILDYLKEIENEKKS